MSMKINQLAVSFKRRQAYELKRGKHEGDVTKEEKHEERRIEGRASKFKMILNSNPQVIMTVAGNMSSFGRKAAVLKE